MHDADSGNGGGGGGGGANNPFTTASSSNGAPTAATMAATLSGTMRKGILKGGRRHFTHSYLPLFLWESYSILLTVYGDGEKYNDSQTNVIYVLH